MSILIITICYSLSKPIHQKFCVGVLDTNTPTAQQLPCNCLNCRTNNSSQLFVLHHGCHASSFMQYFFLLFLWNLNDSPHGPNADILGCNYLVTKEMFRRAIVRNVINYEVWWLKFMKELKWSASQNVLFILLCFFFLFIYLIFTRTHS